MSVGSPRPKTAGSGYAAVVSALHHCWIVLDHSDFLPRTPDRDSDIGRIDGIAVTLVETWSPHGLLHWVDPPGAPGLMQLGQVVEVEIDRERRRRLNRLHSLLHLTFLAARQEMSSARRLHAHVGVDGAELDVELCEPDRADLEAMRHWIEQVIVDDLAISILDGPSSPFWHVDGVGTVPCVGRHPGSTGAIEAFSLDANPVGESVLRLSIGLIDQ